METKKCCICGVDKDRELFSNWKEGIGGLRGSCKACDKEKRDKREKVSGVYKVTAPDGKVYIGESSDIIWGRFRLYKNYNCKSQTYLYDSLIKHGSENHTYEIIEFIGEDRRCRERYWQEYYDVLNPDKGLNGFISECGDKKVIRRPEINEKISASKMGMNTGADSHASTPVIHTATLKIYVSLTEAFPYSGISSYDNFKSKLNGSKRNTTDFMYLSDYEKFGIIPSLEIIPNTRKVVNTLTGETFDSINAAARSVGMSGGVLINQLGPHYVNRTYFVYIEDYIEGIIHYPQDGKKRRIVDESTNKVYYAAHQLESLYNVNIKKINKLLKDPEYKTDGINIRYYIPELDHDKQHVDTGKKGR